MTKEQYFEMCEALNSEPIEEEIPIEFSDFPQEVQLLLLIYRMLRDDWDYMNGNYIGKDMSNIFDILKIYEIPFEDTRFYLELLYLIDSVRKQEIAKQKKNEPKPTN